MENQSSQSFPEMYKYFFEEERLKSFSNWPISNNNKCNAKNMAQAGFIHLRYLDAKCFFCDKALENWEAEDDPWKEHLSHASYCKFAQLQKVEDKLTLKEFFELMRSYTLKAAVKPFELYLDK